MKNKLKYLSVGSVMIATLFVGNIVSAQTPNAEEGHFRGGFGHVGHGMGMMGRGVSGAVASVNGATLTITSEAWTKGGATVTYTVDATNATVTKNGATSTLPNVVVGDKVMVQGTVTGTAVVATSIHDGMPHKGQQGKPMNSILVGTGEPVIGGNVTAVSGAILTVTNKSNITYTVDTTNAKFEKAGATSTLSSIAVGDSVIVQGIVTGTSVVASTVSDRGVAQVSVTTANGATDHQGFMGRIGGFFHHMFGFF